MIPPGSTVGIIGGGQLGRMLCVAAAQLGYRTHIYAPEPSGPAADVSRMWTQGRYDDVDALVRFAGAVDVVTYEFENIPAGPLAGLAGKVHPSPQALEIAQDRVAEKSFASGLGLATAEFAPVASLDELRDALAVTGTPAILKTRRFGYDGKGQARLSSASDAEAAWDAIDRQPAILEAVVPFEAEYSVIVCRGADGRSVTWPVPTNVHVHGILATSTLPSTGIVAKQAKEAARLATAVAAGLGYVGVLTLEFFASRAGPVFNEMAPRVHNSGHWTIEGADTSQFENHIRAVCGLPLGGTDLTGRRVAMRNLIGEQADEWRTILADPRAHLHLYGKGEARPGRKMGHVTIVS